MNRRFIAIFCIVVLILPLSGCFGLGGSGDWNYPLPNGYVVLRINAVDIIVGKQKDAYSVDEVIPRYIDRFSFNERFIGVERLPIEGGIDVNYNEAMTLIETHDFQSLEYYLINTKDDIVFGPFDAAGFEIACKQNDVNDLCDWIDTASIHWNSPEVQTYG